MDKEVLIRFIDMIEAILGRVNSKRLMLLYGCYYWLYMVMGTIGPVYTASIGGGVTFVVLFTFFYEIKEGLSTDALGTVTMTATTTVTPTKPAAPVGPTEVQ